MTLAPRQLVHRGHVEVVGLCFDAPWLDADERRRRVLVHVRDDTTVLELGDAIVLRFASPRRIDVDHCDATPLVDVRGSMVALPLRATELHALPPGGPHLLRVRGGRLDALVLSDARIVDVATWIDLSQWTAIALRPHAAPPPIRPTVHAGDVVDTDARAVLGSSVPPPSEERRRLLAALAAAERGEAPERSTWRDRLARWFSGDDRPQRALPEGAGAGSLDVSLGAPSPPSPPGRFAQWWTRTLAGSPLAGAIGRRQAAYLRKTLAMFEAGDFDGALRHAIPMSSMPGASSQPRSPSLSVPTPRQDLTLRAGARDSPASSIGLGVEGFAHMRDIYRNAARVLEEQGRYEEAAFVLFELLGNDDAGIAMLERHLRYALAAAMAEGRGMNPGLVIRLWFLAGDPARAVRVARRTGAFADAIGRLERTNPEYAARLRVLWAERLASAGDFAAAVDAIWPVNQARALAIRWLDLAIGWGGPTAARLLPRRLSLCGEHDLAAVHDMVLAIVDDDGPDGPSLRRELGVAWQSTTVNEGSPARALGRVLLRRAMLDAVTTGRDDVVTGLGAHLNDRLLGFDTTGTPPPPVVPASSRSHEFPAHERGLFPIHDAIALPRGRILVALGEAGVRLIDRDGRTLRHYERPATSLLVSDSGSRVITMMRRGDQSGTPWTLGRIDLVSGRAEAWCDAHFEAHADDHDGAQWYLAEPDAVSCVDLQSDGLQVLWRVGQLPGRVLALSRSHTRLVFVLQLPGKPALELWTYVLSDGDRRLHARTIVELPETFVEFTVVVSTDGALVVTAPGNPPALLARASAGTIVQTQRHASIVRAEEPEALAWVELPEPGLALVRLSYSSLSPSRTALKLGGTTHARVHRHGERTLVCDDLGRVIELDALDRITHVVLVR